MLHAGIGERHLNNFLATLNLPQTSHMSLKKREVEILDLYLTPMLANQQIILYLKNKN